MVDSTYRRQIAIQVAELWQGEPTSLQHVSDSENCVYSFTASEKKYFLRLTPSHHRSHRQIEAELDFIEYLHRGGVSVSLPLPSVSRRMIEPVQIGSDSFFACAFEEARGERFTFGPGEANKKHFQLRGQTLGRIHALAKRYAPSISSRRFVWDEDDCILNAERYLPKSEEVVWAEYHQLMNWLPDYPKDEQSFGLIHGDFGATNFRCKADRVTVFDFDDCCYHWFAYDLAVVIYPHGWRAEAGALLDSLLKGYREETSCDTDSMADLINFCRLRLLYMFLTHAKKWGFADLSDEQAKWFARKRENMARGYRLNV